MLTPDRDAWTNLEAELTAAEAQQDIIAATPRGRAPLPLAAGLQPDVMIPVPNSNISDQPLPQPTFLDSIAPIRPTIVTAPIRVPTIVPTSVPTRLPTVTPIVTTNTNTNGHESALIQALINQTYLNRIPVIEPPVFTGEPLKYNEWQQSFVSLVEQRAIRDSDRLFYLKRYLGGEALAAVEGFLLLDSPTAYQDAKTLLRERYGNGFILANAYRDKLDSWPQIAGNDHQSLRSYSDFLRQCLCAMKTIDGLAILDDYRENRKMIEHLPRWLGQKWARKVAQHQDTTQTFPKFTYFVDFISKESRILSNPITNTNFDRSATKSQETTAARAYATGQQKASSSPVQAPKGASTATLMQSSGTIQAPEPATDLGSKCYHCNLDHLITACDSFTKLTYDQKIDIVKEHFLCFRCLRKGHKSADCRTIITCSVCQRNHLAIMHDPN